MRPQRAVHGLVFLGFAALVIIRALIIPAQPAALIGGVLLLIAIGLANRMSRTTPRSALVTIPVLLFGWYRSAPISVAVMAALLLIFRAKAGDPPLFGFARTRAWARHAFNIVQGVAIVLLSPVLVVLGLPALTIKWARDRRSERVAFERDLLSPDRTKREEALTGLARLCDPKAAPALIRLLDDPAPSIRETASDALVALRGDGVAQLLSALEDSSPERAARLWRVLGSTRDERGMVPAVQAMEAPSLQLRSAAAEALEMIVSAEKVDSGRLRLKDLEPLAPRIVSLLRDRSAEVRRASAVVLGRLEYEPGADALMSVLNEEEENDDIRGEAAVALGRMGAEQSVADLVRLLSAESLSEYVPRALHLMNRGLPELLEQFEQAPTGIDEFGLSRRSGELWAMYWFAHPGTLDALVEVASSPVDEERRLAADGIASVILQTFLRDRQWRGVDDEASEDLPDEIAALLAHGRPVLSKLSADPVEEVAAAARNNLEWLDRRVTGGA